MNIKELAAEIRRKDDYVELANEKIKEFYEKKDVNPLLDMIDEAEDKTGMVAIDRSGTWLFIPDKPQSLVGAAKAACESWENVDTNENRDKTMHKLVLTVEAALEREDGT